MLLRVGLVAEKQFMGGNEMRKNLAAALILALVLSITGAAFASPLDDYSTGNIAVDFNYRPSLSMENKYGSWAGGGEGTWSGQTGNHSSFDGSLTVGLGKKFALQASLYNPRTNDVGYDYGMNTQEFNVLYKLTKNVSVFAGAHSAKYTRSFNTPVDKTVLQAGLIGYVPLSSKVNAFGVVGFGSNLQNYEVGLSYVFSKNAEFNLSYRYKSVKQLDSGFGNWEDVTAKGLGYGFTFKFGKGK